MNGKTSELKEAFRRRKGFIINVSLLAVVILSLTQGTKPSIDGIFETRDHIAASQAKLETLSQKEDLLKDLDQQELVSQAKKLDDAVSSSVDLPLILATLQSKALEAGVEVGEFSMSSSFAAVALLPVAGAEKLSVFQFKTDLIGNFEGLEVFIEKLSNASPLLRIDSVTFSRDKSQMVLKSYFQPKTIAPAQALPLTALNEKDLGTLQRISKLSTPVLEAPTVATEVGAPRQDPFR